MKYSFLIFLFYFSFGFSQTKIPNISSVTYFKLFDSYDDGPCNPFEDKLGMIVEKNIKNCDDFVFKLIEFKEKSLKWKKKETCCVPGRIGCGEIENKIVYQINGFKDSIYFNVYEDNSAEIFNLKEYFVFTDKENQILKTITSQKDIIDFYNFPHRKVYSDCSNTKNDSINNFDVKILGNIIQNKTFDELSKVFNGFEFITIVKDKYNFFKPEYKAEFLGDYFYTIGFDSDEKASLLEVKEKYVGNEEEQIYSDEFSIQGIKIGDNESILIEKYPNSTKYLYENKKYFINDDKSYSVFVNFNSTITSNNPDSIRKIEFIIENEIIKEITIIF
ncbi:hypothetical protein [Flavobacterium urocaniciphilum]|uniref:Uncharacterized protein n=1 Tax=Flavobacterium urocaniciphilum TaxID=1299341 RepID=A0A1H8Z4W8_9FLAO|nr:hypothetical protein [Flavobacterium urocaniciphilum]SEP59519.1 hypothetical protein SAMN05444005_101495 [Flavobacterium urocaniciphilum]